MHQISLGAKSWLTGVGLFTSFGSASGEQLRCDVTGDVRPVGEDRMWWNVQTRKGKLETRTHLFHYGSSFRPCEYERET